MNVRRFFSYRSRVAVIVAGVLLGALSLFYTNNMARRLREKEQHDVALWAHVMERVTRDISLMRSPFQVPASWMDFNSWRYFSNACFIAFPPVLSCGGPLLL